MKLQQKTLEKLRKLIAEETEYRSGPKLVAFFNSLGFNDIYGQGFPSRWYFVDEKLTKINGTLRLDECIKKLFSPVNFIAKFDVLDKHIKDFNQYLAFDNYEIIRNSREIVLKKSDDPLPVEKSVPVISEDEFLKKEFSNISLDKIGLDSVIAETLGDRFSEIKKCLEAEAPLATIFLVGSTLEGILLGIASKYPKDFNQSQVSPKNKNGDVLQFPNWTLNNFIDVAYDLGLLKEDVKKFSHVLRDFRNYIHPYEQLNSRFSPDMHTAKICWQVLNAALFQLSNNLSKI